MAMQSNQHTLVSLPLMHSASFTSGGAQQLDSEWQSPPWIHQLQMQQRQEQEEQQQHLRQGHGALQGQQLNDFEQQLPTSRSQQQPASELSFAELPRHASVLRQQLQRLKDEIALLQVLSHVTRILVATMTLVVTFYITFIYS